MPQPINEDSLIDQSRHCISAVYIEMHDIQAYFRLQNRPKSKDRPEHIRRRQMRPRSIAIYGARHAGHLLAVWRKFYNHHRRQKRVSCYRSGGLDSKTEAADTLT